MKTNRRINFTGSAAAQMAQAVFSAFAMSFFLVPLSATFVLGQSDSRTAEIQAEREAKRAQLQPEKTSKTEARLVYVERNRLIDRAKAGLNGLRVKWGGLP